MYRTQFGMKCETGLEPTWYRKPRDLESNFEPVSSEFEQGQNCRQ